MILKERDRISGSLPKLKGELTPVFSGQPISFREGKVPQIWRAMKIDGDKPQVGRGAQLLGVRIGALEDGNDVCPDDDGFVQPGVGGMSVSPSVDALPPHRLPRRLHKKYPERFPDATAPNGVHCWWMGHGTFVPERVADRLQLRLDPDDPQRHGLVEPDDKMKTEEYETALEATRERWEKWQE
jgi:hypothetical protein